MGNRRNFIRQGTLLASTLSLSKLQAFVSDEVNLTSKDDGETYWKMVREQFPLSTDKVFLNNGTIGPSPYPVIHEVRQEMEAIESTARYGGNEDVAINAIAGFVGANESEISLTRNVTEGINIVCWGLSLKAGDEVLMTKHEHVGNAGPWLNRAKLHGIVIKTVDLGKSASETLDNVKKAINKNTKAIALPHIPCTIGQVLPVKEICEYARGNGVFSFIDGAHPPGMLKVNLHELGCDFYASCCHKWMLGPKGTGFLYVSDAMRGQLQAYYCGGGVDTGWDMHAEKPMLSGYVDNGHKYYYGTQNSALFKGIAKAIKFHEAIGVEKIEKRIKELSGYMQDQLIKSIKGIEMLTPEETISRGAVVAFKIKEKDLSSIHLKLIDMKYITRYVPENNINCLRVS
ncbi:MAG TPA: aminotransferase class V-fold PLP-dependent enzyme, partial [Bacteroidia bacterium]